MRISRIILPTMVLIVAFGTSVRGLAQTGRRNNSIAEDTAESLEGASQVEWSAWEEAGTGFTPDDTSSDPEASSWYDVAGRSLTGTLRPDLWRPLELETFFTDGWDEQYAAAPHETPHQTWINSADGGFYRLYVTSFNYAAGVSGGGSGNVYEGEFFLFSPLSRRFELGWFFPFVTSTPSASGAQTNSGDLTIAPRFLLEERKNFAATANLFIRTPTGNAMNGQGVTSFSPDVEFWWTEPTQHWVARGALGVTVPLEYSGAKADLLAANPWTGFNASPGAFRSFDARLAIGRHLTPGDDPTISHLVVYVASNLHTQLGGGNNTYFSLTPGFRFHLGKDWYLLGGVEVPLVGPLPFRVQPIAQLIKNF